MKSALIYVLVSLVIAVCAVFIPPSAPFFPKLIAAILAIAQVMIPLLGVGALLKYIACCKKDKCN